MNVRKILSLIIALSWFSSPLLAASPSPRQPNFIVIFCDNLGYGDIGCFGSTKHRTPHIDNMAVEGIRLTDFYVASGVCTPSRASLMTGCYPRRVNMHISDTGGSVLQPVSPKGLHPDEITIAEVLKQKDYSTALIGKWHLGDQPELLPTRQGFDYYYGIPYSDDMTQRSGKPWPALPLMKNEQVIEAPANRDTLTKRYTEESIRFIKSCGDKPFFLLLSHAMPGSTQQPYASAAFQGKSANGKYGDSVEEIDWSTGQILSAIKELGLDENTLIMWTSDNGAPRRNPEQGSSGPLRGWGYSTFEGGMRVPCIVRWPGRIKPGSSSSEILSTMDLLPTFANLAGAKAPQDRVLDGKDIWPVLSNQANARSPHQAFYYYHRDQLQAVRSGKWKLYLALAGKEVQGRQRAGQKLELYDLQSDIGETNDIAADHLAVVKRLQAFANQAREDLGDAGREGKNQRPAKFTEQVSARTLPEK
ncbi:MAG: arylsulfatase [Blastopirellula sp.]|nr:MAG: arylsulfatase [Blastopirellula sp.]